MTSWTAAHQAPLSMRFFQQGYWSVLPFPFPGHLPKQGIDHGSPAVQETWGQTFGWQHPLEKEMTRILSNLAGKPHGQWSLVGCSPWGCKESGPTERLALIVLHTFLYSKVHKSTPTCLGCAHNNMCQTCELSDVIAH